MSRDIVFRPEAHDEMGEAFDWYEQRRAGLGHEFIGCVTDAIDLIGAMALAFPRVHGEVRRTLLKRFPYGVFYMVEGEAIVVLSVFHASRDPAEWKRRD